MPAPNQSCGNCYFRGFVQANVQLRFCRRNPPQAHHFPMQQGNRITFTTHAAFPAMKADDWCGEWKADVTAA